MSNFAKLVKSKTKFLFCITFKNKKSVYHLSVLDFELF